MPRTGRRFASGHRSRPAINEVSGVGLEKLNHRTHRKSLVVDGNIAFIGGIGVADVAVFDPALAARLNVDVERDIARSHKLDLASSRARPLHIRAREQFWSLFGEVF